MRFRLMIALATVMAALAFPTHRLTAEEFVESDYGFSFTIDKDTWHPVPLPVNTLGEPVLVATRSRELKESLAVFVRSSQGTPPGMEERLRSTSDRLRRFVTRIDEAQVLRDETLDLAGRRALSFRFSGPGNGIGVGQGDVTTAQHWLVFPRGQDLIVFQVTAAEDRIDGAFEGLLELAKTARIADERPEPNEDRRFEDDDVQVAIDYPPAPWIRGGYELGDFVAPGYLLRLWSAPSRQGTTEDGESRYACRLAMFLQFPGKAYTPQELIDISIPGLIALPNVEVKQQEVRDIAGKQAMWLLVEGRSKSGSTLVNQGDVPTRQLWVAIPRTGVGGHNILVFLLNAPAADYDQRLTEFEGMLKTLELGEVH